MSKPYLLNMSEFEMLFVKEAAWQQRLKVAEYLRFLIDAEIEKNPEIVERIKAENEKN